MLARKYLEQVITNCQLALNELNRNDMRRAVGLIDEIEDRAEAAKWILINEIIEEDGGL